MMGGGMVGLAGNGWENVENGRGQGYLLCSAAATH